MHLGARLSLPAACSRPAPRRRACVRAGSEAPEAAPEAPAPEPPVEAAAPKKPRAPRKKKVEGEGGVVTVAKAAKKEKAPAPEKPWSPPKLKSKATAARRKKANADEEEVEKEELRESAREERRLAAAAAAGLPPPNAQPAGPRLEWYALKVRGPAGYAQPAARQDCLARASCGAPSPPLPLTRPASPPSACPRRRGTARSA